MITPTKRPQTVQRIAKDQSPDELDKLALHNIPLDHKGDPTENRPLYVYVHKLCTKFMMYDLSNYSFSLKAFL